LGGNKIIGNQCRNGKDKTKSNCFTLALFRFSFGLD